MMENFTKRLLDQISHTAEELEEGLGLHDPSEEEVYADDAPLREAVNSTKVLMRESQMVLGFLETLSKNARECSEKEQAVARAIAPNAALEQRLSPDVVLSLVSLASVKVSHSRSMENFAMRIAEEAYTEFRTIRERYRMGFVSYVSEYKALRKEALRLQRKAQKTSKRAEILDIEAKLDAAEPIWRAKGETLRAEADALTKKLEEFNLHVCEKIIQSRPALIQNSVNDFEALAKEHFKLPAATIPETEAKPEQEEIEPAVKI